MTPLERAFNAAVRKEAFKFSQWAARNHYKFIRGRWRKIGTPDAALKDDIWKEYKQRKRK